MADRTFYVENLTALNARQLEAFGVGWEDFLAEADDAEEMDDQLMAEWNLAALQKEYRRRAREAAREVDPELERLLALLS